MDIKEMKFSELLNRWMEIHDDKTGRKMVLPMCDEKLDIEERMDELTDFSELKNRLSISLNTDQDFTGDGWENVASVAILLDGEVISETYQFRLPK